jgi:NAD(P)H-dependent FMN reductase
MDHHAPHTSRLSLLTRRTNEKETSMSEITVLALVGSLRAASVNRQIAELAAETAPAGITVNLYQGDGGGLGELPLYNGDIDTPADLPASASALRGAVAQADAILVVTPEYNGSIPGALKNAIDWLSRPYGQNALAAKPLAVVGASMGQYGGVWAHDETRKSFGIAGAEVVDAPAFSLSVDALGGKHPRESHHVVASLNDVLTKLAAEAG